MNNTSSVQLFRTLSSRNYGDQLYDIIFEHDIIIGDELTRPRRQNRFAVDSDFFNGVANGGAGLNNIFLVT
ncbi:MAG TPA: hypothetical protein VIS10_07260, partial [Anaerolineales bacterium]